MADPVVTLVSLRGVVGTGARRGGAYGYPTINEGSGWFSFLFCFYLGCELARMDGGSWFDDRRSAVGFDVGKWLMKDGL